MMQARQRENYERPVVEVLGTLDELTQATFQNTNADYYFAGAALGS